jgi:hyperosmotically inducible protein
LKNENKKGMDVMKQLRLAAVLLTTLAMGAASGCASSGRQQAAAEQSDDTTITAGVKAAIAREPDLKVSEIQVETRKGIVQLSGYVSSPDDIATVASVARTVKGVKSIKNDLRLK